MNHPTALIRIAALVSALTPLHAEPEVLREFKRLQEQREAAIDSAVEPINRKYAAALEPLLRKSQQSGDVEAASKIKHAQYAVALCEGSWTLRVDGNGYSGVRRFKLDETYQGEDGDINRWTMEGEKLRMKRASGGSDSFQLPISEGRMRGKNERGEGLILSRNK